MKCAHETIDFAKLDEVLDRYGNVAGSLITILQQTQELYGYLPVEAMYRLSERTGIKPAKILELPHSTHNSDSNQLVNTL